MNDPLQDRQVRRRLAVLRHAEKVSGNVAITCRYYGISRQCCYAASKPNGPEGLCDHSRRPHHSPTAAEAEVVEKIVHLTTGVPLRPSEDRHVSSPLPRRDDQSIRWRILERLGLNRLPASQRYQCRDRRWKRCEKVRPGRRIQIGVKFIEALSGTSIARSTTVTAEAAPVGSGNPRDGAASPGLHGAASTAKGRCDRDLSSVRPRPQLGSSKELTAKNR